MKVRVTIDVPERDRYIIGLAQTGEHEQATREMIVKEIEHAFDIHMTEPRAAWDRTTEEIRQAILRSIGKEAQADS